ncbi:MAG: VOC family protein [bacterium]|jgi:lactoylglutathione lyase
MQNRRSLTHIALRVKNIEKTVEFYKKYASLELISQRKEHSTRVAWLGNPEVNDSLIIVLLEMPYDSTQNLKTSFDHIGIDLYDKKRVDEVASLARKEGILCLEPDDHGPVAGYLCMVRDPDGNQVEFSCGQEVFEVLNHTPEKE